LTELRAPYRIDNGNLAHIPPKPLDPRWRVALVALQRMCEIFSGGFKLMAEAVKQVLEMG